MPGLLFTKYYTIQSFLFSQKSTPFTFNEVIQNAKYGKKFKLKYNKLFYFFVVLWKYQNCNNCGSILGNFSHRHATISLKVQI